MDETAYSVLLLPVEFVQGTEKGSGEYETITDLPVWTPDDGTNGTVSFTSDSSASQIGDAVLVLSGTLSPTKTDTVAFQCSISGTAQQFGLVETGSNSLVFSATNGNCQITITDYTGLNLSGADTLHIIVSSPLLPQSVQCTLTETAPNNFTFANFTTTVENRTPDAPTQSHSGVFYLRSAPGLAGMQVKMKASMSEVTFQLADAQDGSNYTISPPLLLKNAASASSMSAQSAGPMTAMRSAAITALMAVASSDTVQVIETSGTDSVETTIGDTSASPPSITSKKRLPTFLGAALNGHNLKELGAGHFDNIDKIIGRKSGIIFSTPPKLGYSQSTIKEQVTLGILKAALPKHSIFYLVAHGLGDDEINPEDTNFQGCIVWSDGWGGKRDHLVTADEISGSIGSNSYNLVFLNSCGGANDQNGVATAYAGAFKAKNYVSWPTSVTVTSAAGAAIQFFNQLDNGATVSSARNGVKAAHMNSRTNFADFTEYNLDSMTSDDTVIIDNTPSKSK